MAKKKNKVFGRMDDNLKAILESHTRQVTLDKWEEFLNELAKPQGVNYGGVKNEA